MSFINNLMTAVVMLTIIAIGEHASSFAIAAEGDEQVLVAKATKEKSAKTKKEKKDAPKGRERFLDREAQVKQRQRNIDFDAVDISGERKTPFGSLVEQNKSNKNFDLIKIRMRWHPEMIQSTSSLETGKSK